MKRIKYVVASFVCLLTTASFSAPVFAQLFDDAKDQALCGASATDGGTAGCPDNGADAAGKVNSTLESVINIFSIVVGVVAVIMLIIGGVRYTTSQGDGASTSAARGTIIYAVVGLVVVSMAQIIVRFVLGRASTS